MPLSGDDVGAVDEEPHATESAAAHTKRLRKK
jgi:hypothetical protein